ncbi:SAF domain-containing protein [Brachybacterium huguangmaarense]|uniref:SAF domain-containing protein n=1 Tax=Brachybacterium huguangmaarense TaxID=1652028 RepID=A0ABY6FXS4_9MICO|nr:SAF domain-containing protein [Brachybacterium huguangmaarense]UYG15723.1 SAF domain-containing protein [Brachybacterium huguangmaarense]
MTAAALRLRRPRWRDPRLLIGIVLVLVSVIAGMLLLSRLSATTTVLVARGDVVVGDILEADDFTTAELRLGEQVARYADSPDDIPDGAVATATVHAGELLPLSAIGQADGVELRPVVVAVDSAVAASVGPGAQVELWTTPTGTSTDARATSTLLVEDGVVRSVDEGSSLGMRSMTIEVLVAADDVPAVLEALAADDRLDVIAVPGARGATP